MLIFNTGMTYKLRVAAAAGPALSVIPRYRRANLQCGCANLQAAPSCCLQHCAAWECWCCSYHRHSFCPLFAAGPAGADACSAVLRCCQRGRCPGARLQVGLVEGGHDGTAAGLPGLQIGGDEALPHDRLQDLRQHPFVVVLRVVLRQQVQKGLALW